MFKPNDEVKIRDGYVENTQRLDEARNLNQEDQVGVAGDLDGSEKIFVVNSVDTDGDVFITDSNDSEYVVFAEVIEKV